MGMLQISIYDVNAGYTTELNLKIHSAMSDTNTYHKAVVIKSVQN